MEHTVERDDTALSCCKKMQNRLCCNRIHAANKNVYETSLESSLSSKTLESVQDAIDSKISASKAKLHRYLTTPNWGPKKKFAPYNIWHFPLALFNDYGIGTKLYFEFLVKLALLSLFVSIVYIPIYAMLYSCGSPNDDSSIASFEQLSLGNLGDNNNTFDCKLFGTSFDYRPINTYIAYTDFLCILLLLSFIIWFEWRLSAKEREYDDMTTTVGDYSIEVLNLPPNISSRRSLANFFESEWGEVMDISLCYNDGHIVKMYLAHSKIIQNFTKSKVMYSKAMKASTRLKETNKLQRLQTKLDKSTMHMMTAAQQFDDGNRYCVKAYVTFENEPERNNCLRDYYQQKRIFCTKNPRFVYEGHSLIIREAPEPSNILYLNHGYTTCQVYARRMITTVLSTAIIIASFGLIFAAQYAAKSSAIDTAHCEEDIDASEDINCYCAQIGLISAMTDSVCLQYVNAFVKSSIFKISSSVIIILVNLILSHVIYSLVEKEKHFTVSSHQSALAKKIFLSQFLNTALTILIINCDLSSLGIGIGNIFSGQYDINFTAEWCHEIGNSIIITMILGCFNPHLLPMLMIKYESKKRRKAIQTVSTQNELNEKFNGKPFTLADRFGNISAKLCVILLYTPLLPLLWFILFVTCSATYWFNKIFFLRCAAIPPKYDTRLARNAVYFVKIGISLHLLMAIWVFGSEYRDPQYLNYQQYLPSMIARAYPPLQYESILGILCNTNSLPFFVLFLILHFINLCKYCYSACACSRANSLFEDEAGLLPFSQEYVKSDSMELYLLCTQATLKSAFGADLLPMQEILNVIKMESAQLEYKKQIAKEMVDELMNVDIDIDRDSKLNDTKFLNLNPEFWNIREVGVWLERIKCGKQYMYQFMFKKVSGQRLLNVTDQFLEESIEIKNLVHRSQILKAVRKLRIKAGLDKPLKKKKLTKAERKQLEANELQNYCRHLLLTQQYTQFAQQCQHQIDNLHSM